MRAVFKVLYLSYIDLEIILRKILTGIRIFYKAIMVFK